MDYLKSNKMKLILSLFILFLMFQVYKFIRVRIANMDLPKGKIVFSSGADGDDEIYIMNINGTNIKQLTKNSYSKINLADDDEPSFSPDGKEIVFCSARFETRDYKIITNIRGRAIGEQFSGGSTDIFIMNSDGTNQIPLTYQDLCSYPFFSPDSKKIIFRSNKPYSVRMKDLYSGELKILNSNSPSGEFIFSKDGMKIFDNLSSDISVTDITGINKVRLTHFSDPQQIKNNTGKRLGVTFSSSLDGKKFVLVTIEGKGNQLNRLFKFYTMNIDGSDLKEIYRLETEVAGTLFDFKYSPDGNNIIFWFDHSTQGIYSLNLMNKNIIDLTGKKEKWDPFSEFNFVFTPDGKKIVFVAHIFPKNYRFEYLLHNIKGWIRYLLLWRKTPSYDNKYLCIMDIDGKNYRKIAKLPLGTELGRDFIHWEH